MDSTKDKEQVIVFEPNMNGPAHTEINAGLLTIIQNIHPNANLLFIADRNHYNALQKKNDLKRWQYDSIKVFNYVPIFLFINEILLSYRIFKLFLLKRNVNCIYFLGILPFSHILLSKLNRIFRRNIIIALHGQMEAYLPNTKIGKTKYYYGLSKNVFSKNDNIRYLIFGESIKDNLIFLFKNRIEKIIVIDQPYVFDEVVDKKKLNNGRTFIFGIIGRADNSKNINQLFVLIDALKEEIEKGKIIIKIVGRMYLPVPIHYQNYLTYHTETISNETFEKEISSLDYALSFTDEGFYRATPSGVFFDCIKWSIPIYGLKNEFISYYFDRFGEFGRLFSSTNKMAHEIKLKLKDGTIYIENEQKSLNEIFKNLRKELSIESLTTKMKAQL